MNWPWVARMAYDAVASERDHLRVDNAKLTDALTRISRKEAGMSETPRELRAPMEPMPRELVEHIRGYAGSNIQKAMRDQAYRRYAAGAKWSDIMADVIAEEEK